MVQVELTKIIIDEKRQDQIIVLKEKNSDRQFPIVIGFIEASSIKMKLSGIEPPRPMTHDLLHSVIKGLDATMEYVVEEGDTAWGLYLRFQCTIDYYQMLERQNEKVDARREFYKDLVEMNPGLVLSSQAGPILPSPGTPIIINSFKSEDPTREIDPYSCKLIP